MGPQQLLIGKDEAQDVARVVAHRGGGALGLEDAEAMGEDVLDLRDAEARPRDVPRALERVLDERRDELRVGRVAGAGHGDDV